MLPTRQRVLIVAALGLAAWWLLRRQASASGMALVGTPGTGSGNNLLSTLGQRNPTATTPAKATPDVFERLATGFQSVMGPTSKLSFNTSGNYGGGSYGGSGSFVGSGGGFSLGNALGTGTGSFWGDALNVLFAPIRWAGDLLGLLTQNPVSQQLGKTASLVPLAPAQVGAYGINAGSQASTLIDKIFGGWLFTDNGSDLARKEADTPNFGFGSNEWLIGGQIPDPVWNGYSQSWEIPLTQNMIDIGNASGELAMNLAYGGYGFGSFSGSQGYDPTAANSVSPGHVIGWGSSRGGNLPTWIRMFQN